MDMRGRPVRPEEPLLLGADRTIYLPALLAGVLYGGLWLVMIVLGRGDSALARALLLVAAIGTPLLLLHAWLRARACGLRLTDDELSYRRGWLRPDWHHVPLQDVTGAHVVYGPAGRLLGSGALIVTLRDGRTLRLVDIAGAGAAARQIEQRSGALRYQTTSR